MNKAPERPFKPSSSGRFYDDSGSLHDFGSVGSRRLKNHRRTERNSRLSQVNSRGRIVGLISAAVLTACASAENPLGLEPDSSGSASNALTMGRVLITHSPDVGPIGHGFDIKQPGKSDFLTAAVAGEVFNTYGFQILRIPIRAMEHPSAGAINAGAYDDIVAAVGRAKAANPGVRIFASLKLMDNDAPSFPGWVKDGDCSQGGSLNGDAYSRLLMDYVKYMEGRGIAIDYIGPDNENKNLECEIKAWKFANIVDRLKARYASNGMTPPVIVGNCAIGPNGGSVGGIVFLEELYARGEFDRIDRASLHGGKDRSLDYLNGLKEWNTAARSKIKWDSEFHWENDSMDGFPESKHALLTLFDDLEKAGMRQLTWWNFRPKNRFPTEQIAHLQSAFVQATVGGYTLPTDDEDGVAVDAGKFNTRAFKQGSDVTLIVINDTDTDRNGKWVEISGRTFDRAVTYTLWTASSVAGSTGSVSSYPSSAVFAMDFPRYSITVVRVPNVR